MNTPAHNENKVPYSTAMSLRIWHPSILCDEVTKAIGVLPALQNDVGTPRRTRTGQILEGVYDQTYWVHKFRFPTNSDVESCIAKALEPLNSKQDFLKKIASTGGRCELFLGIFLDQNAGIELGSALVRRVAEVGLGLSFDVYLPEIGKKESAEIDL